MAADVEEYIAPVSSGNIYMPYSALLAVEVYNSTHVKVSSASIDEISNGNPPFRTYFRVGSPGPLQVYGPLGNHLQAPGAHYPGVLHPGSIAVPVPYASGTSIHPSI